MGHSKQKITRNRILRDKTYFKYYEKIWEEAKIEFNKKKKNSSQNSVELSVAWEKLYILIDKQ